MINFENLKFEVEQNKIKEIIMSVPFLLKNGERVIRGCRSRMESKAEVTSERSSMLGFRRSYESKTVDVEGEYGTLYLTNLRMVFVVTRGVFSRTTTIIRNAALDDIENISVSGTFGKGLNVDWNGGAHDRFNNLDDPIAWENEIRVMISAPRATITPQTSGNATKYCINCGASMPSVATYCPNCGTQQVSPPP